MSKKLLVVHSSARENRSLTRDLAQTFEDSWTASGGGAVAHRDVGVNPPAIISEAWIDACFTDPAERSDAQNAVLAESDELVAEIVDADVIALCAPMYNYSMPAALKAWFDLIARIGVTFSFDLARGDVPIEPILSGKKLVVLSSRGEFGFAEGGERAHLNGLDPAIRASAHYLGADANDMETIAIEYQEFGDARFDESVAKAQARTKDVAAQVAA
ncbi:NAD(P)H-dependent oxidoreductase [Rhodobacteraceae bacterium B1Z28]|uniref:FMN dependent NADH:quinone oxidoreductase n=1 Tax=Ruegeria haliotis TaxID=2747601 RepID=A0ABX2PS56_9RHOB|nr:NAD(P)H-dependent oxidoreductase [Ruegeria haliotis]NVO57013.1 NAD(P)H-dependent oxidoreductase [Ruegeria haliotis]